MAVRSAATSETSSASAAASLGSRLQDGIYFRRDETPEPSYRLLLLNIKTDTSPGAARAAIGSVWGMLRDLRARDLAADVRPDPPIPRPAKSPARPLPTGELTCQLGFGARLFDRYQPMPRPKELRLLAGRPFRQLRWVAESDRRLGETDLALQLIGRTELAVNRAVAEVWMLILQQSLPLEIVAVHGGFNREDRRSWIGFHDGISNMDVAERPAVITVTSREPAWMEGGTYMAFLRMAVDLERWRRLPREHQELIIGRDKLTGSPLEDRGPGAVPRAAKGCPMFGDASFSSRHIDPPSPPATAELLRVSHVHRTNPNRGVSADDNRIFRQGYEFLEQLPDGRLRLGVNFVSFQGRLAQLTNILTLDGWLGNVNFGGFPDQRHEAPAPLIFVELIAGGFYAVPPNGAAAELFPGSLIF